MASYKIFDLPHSNAIFCVTFSCWDNTAGPLTKCLWIDSTTPKPDSFKVKQLSRLTLKTEVTRDDFAIGNMAKSNGHLNDLVSDVVDLFLRLERARLDPVSLKVQNTFICDSKSTNDLLWRAINSMMLSFGRVVVLGNSDKAKEKVNKWVRTLSLMVPRMYRDRCFTCEQLNQPIVPNALVQGVLLAEELMDNMGFLMTLYTTCDYPVTVLDVSRSKVYRTSSYVFHSDHQMLVKEKQLEELLYPPAKPRLTGLLEDAKADICVSSDLAPIISAFRKQLCSIEVAGRLNYITQYMAYLHSKATSIIEQLSPVMQEGSERLARTDLAKYQLMNKDDLDVMLSLAEFLLPGAYGAVADDSLDNKPNKVIEAL